MLITMDEQRDLGGKLKINGKTYAIFGGLNTIGRNREAVVNIKSLGVSQHHAIIILIDDDLHFISDLKSSNATFLNGRRLAPLHLYQLETGASLKFADIEGIYEKCNSQNAKLPSPNDSQCTQNFTQSFYGRDTQSMDETNLLINHHSKDKIVPTQSSFYIPTQVLANVANAIETSYQKLHEQTTQPVLGSPSTHEAPTQLVEFAKVHEIPTQLVPNKIFKDSHEMPTQLVPNKIFKDSHEMPTQLVEFQEEEDISMELAVNETLNHLPDDQLDSRVSHSSELGEKLISDSNISASDIHEAETQKLDTQEINTKICDTISDSHEAETQILAQENEEGASHDVLENSINRSLENQITSEHIRNTQNNTDRGEPLGTTTNVPLNTSQNSSTLVNGNHKSGVISKPDSDGNSISQSVVSKNSSSQSTVVIDNLTQDSDMINPLGISRNVFEDSQNSINRTQNESLDDSDSDVIRPVKKSINKFDSSQDSIAIEDDGKDTQDEGSDDSLDFMTMQKITDIERKYSEAIQDLDSKAVAESSTIVPTSNNEKLDINSQFKNDCQKENGRADLFSINAESDLKRKENVPNIGDHNQEKYEMSDSETDIDDGTIKRNILQNKDAETDNEKTKDVAASSASNKHSIGKPNISGSETDHDNDYPNSEPNLSSENRVSSSKPLSGPYTDIEEKKGETHSGACSGINIIKRKKKTKCRSKKKSTISDSESETDIEIERKNRSPPTTINSYSGSETNIEKVRENSEFEIDIEVKRKKRSPKIVVFDSGSDTDIEKEPKQVDENKIEDTKKNKFPESKCEVADVQTRQEDHSSSLKQNNTLGINETLNDSDFIPATQECNGMVVDFSSQNSKLENSEESFRLGLTQLMEDDPATKITTSQDNNLTKMNDPKVADLHETRESVSDVMGNGRKDLESNEISQNGCKKFVFKKKSSNTIVRADITLDYQDDEVDDSKAPNVYEAMDKLNSSNDEHIFLQPTQKLSIRKKTAEENDLRNEQIYMVSTQKFDGSPNKIDTEDIYIQSTQKLTSQVIIDPGEGTSKMNLDSQDIYQMSTQKFAEAEQPREENGTGTTTKEDDDDLDDLFATQTNTPKTTPNKRLECELEFMFATQKAVPTEESLDKIKDIVFQKQIVSTKLPEENSDLEAILESQRIPDSPKSTKPYGEQKNVETELGRSIESQLEVLFASQVANLPADKFNRPVNPLVNILGEETQEAESAVPIDKNINQKKVSPEEALFDVQNKTSDVDELSECSGITNKKNSRHCLEQSFALLEAKSTKIRRSARNANCEEITVSCPKSRMSMAVAPNEKFEKVLEVEEKPLKRTSLRATRKRQYSSSSEMSNSDTKQIGEKSLRATRKRQNSSSSELSNTDMKQIGEKSRRQKKGRTSETSTNPDDDHPPNVSTSSSKSFKTNKTSVSLEKIKEIQNDDSESETSSSERNINKLNSEKCSIRRSTKTRTTVDANSVDVASNRIKENVKKIGTEILNTRTSTRRTSKMVTKQESNDIENNSPNEIEVVKEPRGRSSRMKNSKELDSSTSHGLKRIPTIEVTTPLKTRRLTEKATSSTERIDIEESPSRSKRKLKPKVVFTMMESPKLESIIKQLGGSIVDSVDACTVLITKSVKRSMKLLSAVGQGKPICSEKWVEDSKKENQFLDPWDYILIDKEAESKWEFSLLISLKRSVQVKLFEDYTFHLLVKTASDVLEGAIVSCGGKIVARCPKEVNNFVVVASPEQKDKYRKFMKQNSRVLIVEPEAIFDGVLRQEIRFERHLLV